ncbi:hypothetical protein AA313_de0209985 [Arthrobotrys entomopaga]|nr:hypothetical protein AA313_de0209985 [Arthrobotrys entomopaga]
MKKGNASFLSHKKNQSPSFFFQLVPASQNRRNAKTPQKRPPWLPVQLRQNLHKSVQSNPKKKTLSLSVLSFCSKAWTTWFILVDVDASRYLSYILLKMISLSLPYSGITLTKTPTRHPVGRPVGPSV